MFWRHASGDQMSEAITAIQNRSYIPSYWWGGAQGGKNISHLRTELHTVVAPPVSVHVVDSLPLSLMKWFQQSSVLWSHLSQWHWLAFCHLCFPSTSSTIAAARASTMPLPCENDNGSWPCFPLHSCSSHNICVGISSQNHKFDRCLRNIFF